MAKKSKHRTLKKYLRYIYTFALLALVIVLIIITTKHQSTTEKTTENLSAMAWKYYQLQAPALGLKASQPDLKQSCYRQDNPAKGILIGPTICQAQVKKDIVGSSPPQIRSTIGQLSSITKDEGFENFLGTAVPATEGTSLVANKGLCQVGADYSPENIGPNESDNTWTYTVTCSQIVKKAPVNQPQ